MFPARVIIRSQVLKGRRRLPEGYGITKHPLWGGDDDDADATGRIDDDDDCGDDDNPFSMPTHLASLTHSENDCDLEQTTLRKQKM